MGIAPADTNMMNDAITRAYKINLKSFIGLQFICEKYKIDITTKSYVTVIHMWTTHAP